MFLYPCLRLPCCVCIFFGTPLLTLPTLRLFIYQIGRIRSGYYGTKKDSFFLINLKQPKWERKEEAAIWANWTGVSVVKMPPCFYSLPTRNSNLFQNFNSHFNNHLNFFSSIVIFMLGNIQFLCMFSWSNCRFKNDFLKRH